MILIVKILNYMLRCSKGCKTAVHLFTKLHDESTCVKSIESFVKLKAREAKADNSDTVAFGRSVNQCDAKSETEEVPMKIMQYKPSKHQAAPRKVTMST